MIRLCIENIFNTTFEGMMPGQGITPIFFTIIKARKDFQPGVILSEGCKKHTMKISGRATGEVQVTNCANFNTAGQECQNKRKPPTKQGVENGQIALPGCG
jgi:hypothetical protein